MPYEIASLTQTRTPSDIKGIRLSRWDGRTRCHKSFVVQYIYGVLRVTIDGVNDDIFERRIGSVDDHYLNTADMLRNTAELWNNTEQMIRQWEHIDLSYQQQLKDWLKKFEATLEPFSKLPDCGHIRDLLAEAREHGVI